MDQTEVSKLQRRIDDATAHLKESEAMLDDIKQMLKVLQDATSDDNLKAVSHSSGSTPHVLTVLSPEEPPLSDEEKQFRERAVRAFNLNPPWGIELLKESLGGSSHLASFFVGKIATPDLHRLRHYSYLTHFPLPKRNTRSEQTSARGVAWRDVGRKRSDVGPVCLCLRICRSDI